MNFTEAQRQQARQSILNMLKDPELVSRRRAAAIAAKRTHGMFGTKVLSCWHNMISRTRDPNNSYYGAKGITVCDRWKEFGNFLADMGRTPDETQAWTVGRREHDQGYYPGNCFWQLRSENNRDAALRMWAKRKLQSKR